MSMSKHYLVDVKSITSKVSRSEFQVDDLETLAQSILAADGLLSPLLLKQTGIESYEVLVGDREYYAAVRAKEINPRAAEMVNAFIVPDKLEGAAVEQLKSLRPAHPDIPSESVPTKTPPGSPSGAAQRITNLESRMDEALRDIKQTQQREVQRLEQQIIALQRQIPQKVEPLEIFNTANTVELLQKMAIAGIRGKTAEKLIKGIEKARVKAPFTSFADVVSRVDGLAEKRMLSILDACSGLF